MATGSGKTMASEPLHRAGPIFHALYEAESPMTPSFLVIAPNLIVFERLKADFGDGATFRRDPLVPLEWMHDFDLAGALAGRPIPDHHARCAVSHEHSAAITSQRQRARQQTGHQWNARGGDGSGRGSIAALTPPLPSDSSTYRGA